jgi:hypothetical protein
MHIIAHRGLLDGPNPDRENSPYMIDYATEQGFEVEVDLRYNDGSWWLGHYISHYEIPVSFVLRPHIWSHCKTVETFYKMREVCESIDPALINYFYHDSDKVVLTSTGAIWTYMGIPETQHTESICVLPEVTYGWDNMEEIVNSGKWAGFCTDYPVRLSQLVRHRYV